MRESCMILARQLAFADDPDMLDLLSHTAVLLVVTLNGDGRAADTRGQLDRSGSQPRPLVAARARDEGIGGHAP